MAGVAGIDMYTAWGVSDDALMAFSKALVERCAAVCEDKYQTRSIGGFPREASTARALRDEIHNLIDDHVGKEGGANADSV